MDLLEDDLLARLRSLFQRATMGISTYGDASDLNTVLEQLIERMAKSQVRCQNSEKRIRTLTEAIPVGLLIVSAAGSVEAYNKQSLKLFQCAHEDLFGTPLHLLVLIDDETPFTIEKDAMEGQYEKALQVIAKRPDGSSFPADCIVRSFADESGNRCLILVQDVTVRRDLERMKEEFVSMLSHDLRTPLTSIQAFLSMLESGMYDSQPDEMKERVRGIDNEVTRLIGIINSLLNVYKLESGRLDMFFEVVGCDTIIDRSVEAVEALARNTNIRLNVAPMDGEVFVKVDVDYIIQVLVNLVSNAIKFSPPGEAIDLSVDASDLVVTFRVADRGPGIKPEFKEKLFNRFEQASLSDSRVKGGTGLGLAFAKAIVEQHDDGRIGVDSVAGSGSIFWFELPRFEIQ